MTTFNTGNQIGSTDARDRLDNSENMDILENSTTLNEHPDRLGTMRKTRKGMEDEHNAQIAAHEAEFADRILKMAFTPVGTFTTGATLTDARQTLLWEVSEGGDGHYYSWSGTFPKAVTAGSTPSTSGGVGAGDWVDRSDVTLRSEINIVQKRFACVADMVADTSLIVGQIVETIGYYGGWVATLSKPKGGNRYEIVPAGTCTDDGGSFITLSNGLQAKGLFDSVIDFCCFGAIDDGVTDNKQFFQSAFDYAQDNNYVRGDRYFYHPKTYVLPASDGVYASSGNVTVAENAKIDLQDNTILPIGNPLCMFKLNLRDYTNSDSSTPGYYYRAHVQGFEFINCYVGSKTRGFGVTTLTPDFDHFFYIDGGWIIRSAFKNLKTHPGCALKSMLHFDLTHHNVNSYEVGVPDAISLENISCQYAENASYTITFEGDDTYIGTGSRCGNIDFKNIYSGATNAIDFNRVKNASSDFGVIRNYNVEIRECGFDFLFGGEHLINVPNGDDESLSKFFACKFKYLNVEKNSDRGTGRGPMLLNGVYEQCDFDHIYPYSEMNKLTRAAQCLDITAYMCIFNRFILKDLGHGSNLLPSDYINLRLGSYENRFKCRPQSNTITYKNFAWHAAMFTVPKEDTIFDWMQARTFTTLKDKDVTTSTNKSLLKLSAYSLDVSTVFEGKFAVEQYSGSTSTWELYATYSVSGVQTTTVLATISLASGSDGFVSFTGAPVYKTPVWNDYSVEYGFVVNMINGTASSNVTVSLNPVSFDGVYGFEIGARCTAVSGTDVNWTGSVCTTTNSDVYVNQTI